MPNTSDATTKTDTNGSGNGAANGAGVPPTPPSTGQTVAPPPSAVQPTAPTASVEPMRLRVKVWMDPATKRRYLMPTAMLDPKKGMMTAYAMTDEDTKIIKLSPAEWNALPFHYFKEDGPAPRASTRVPDLVAR